MKEGSSSVFTLPNFPIISSDQRPRIVHCDPAFLHIFPHATPHWITFKERNKPLELMDITILCAQQSSFGRSFQNQTMSTQPVPNIIPEIKKWLDANWGKISSFWLHADWRDWARYDLYAHLEKGLCREVRGDYPKRDYSVSHSVPLWGEDEAEVDLTVGPAAKQKMSDMAVWICAARPGENDTSFGNFVEKFQTEWKLVQDLTEKNCGGDFEGGKLLFLGIGEKAYEAEDSGFGDLKPEYFGFGGRTQYEGAVYAYYLWLDLLKPEE